MLYALVVEPCILKERGEFTLVTVDHRDVSWPHADIAWEIQHDVNRGGNGGFCCIVNRAISMESFMYGSYGSY